MAGALMAVLSVFIFFAWGYSLKRSIGETASIPLAIPDVQVMAEGRDAGIAVETHSPLEKPIRVTMALFTEALGGVRVFGERLLHSEASGAVTHAFNGLGYVEAGDVGEAALEVPREWFGAMRRFISRGLAALRATNDNVLDGIGQAAGYVFE
ncbi:MAG: hypothetical protein A3I44_05455 [Candidatus Sungbacteria bacterium RIFCSPLOWO2_02_FULL_51_17]|uniref:Uncharacterized protein n=1 Tax=Candidatus Sungbacteria bacterium RIFCSPHIGHO2_02_FULL_51_29 TaxID=1802273 RepID=A0A1G2KRA7_9BACT|nr:MAG: hypothetical protein A2676_06020 [Candidatus Sungbacteria bacterium RIFCSPHIGHO2_01_FULL_51_22]OHA01955.1 MAG: hypothetical protein A3C16_02335 [Candidatus Sungbacteria bacterium RIFCSPHIGHO2_02_FULL_51_29]OHA11141.1 MAG: hypothetical protein A3I44_05455 [Candidatus Sungbacteria bacterium RIFCSPLOWO2_02_FULL_51_17]